MTGFRARRLITEAAWTGHVHPSNDCRILVRPTARPVAAGLVAGSAHGQLARSNDCAASTVTRISAHLGRHAMLLLWRALMSLQGRLREPVVFDHFEIFELTQDLPFGVGTPVGADSWFVYGVDPAPHSRTGRRSPVQERRLKRRARRPARGGYIGSTRRVLDRLLPLRPGGRRLRLVSDGHKSYLTAVKRHPCAAEIQTEYPIESKTIDPTIFAPPWETSARTDSAKPNAPYAPAPAA